MGQLPSSASYSDDRPLSFHRRRIARIPVLLPRFRERSYSRAPSDGWVRSSASCAFKHASKGFLNTIILKNPMVFKYSWRNVGNVMSTDVFTVSAEASVREAASAMVEHDIGSVVVVEGKAPRRRVKGLVTDHSLLRLLAA